MARSRKFFFNVAGGQGSSSFRFTSVYLRGASALPVESLRRTINQSDLHVLSFIYTMKLIIAGASGYVATEVIRQSLVLPQITAVVALARRAVSAPAGISAADQAKFQSAVVKNYDEYPDEVKKQFADADACIW